MNYKHGHGSGRGTPTFRSWQRMMNRCFNPRASQFKYYGGRGVTVCERWKQFKLFLIDMGERPSGHSIDRFPDVNGNYEPGNCRWASVENQQRNKRSVVPVVAYGLSLTLPEWEKRLGVSRKILWQRRNRGMSPEKIVIEERR